MLVPEVQRMVQTQAQAPVLAPVLAPWRTSDTGSLPG